MSSYADKFREAAESAPRKLTMQVAYLAGMAERGHVWKLTENALETGPLYICLVELDETKNLLIEHLLAHDLI